MSEAQKLLREIKFLIEKYFSDIVEFEMQQDVAIIRIKHGNTRRRS